MDIEKIDPASAKHIKDGKIRQKNIGKKDYIIIPYDNAELIYDLLIKGKLDKNTELKHYIVREFGEKDCIRLEKNVNDVIYYYYYIPVVIKEHVKFAKIMEHYQDKNNSSEKKRKKEDKAAKINENNTLRYNNKKKFDETMKSINSVNDILHDNELLSFPPCKKISQAYCYIHPINVILYDKTIEYGLIWSKNNNVIINDDYVFASKLNVEGELKLDTFINEILPEQATEITSILMDDEQYVLHDWRRKEIFVKTKVETIPQLVSETILSLRHHLVKQQVLIHD